MRCGGSRAAHPETKVGSADDMRQARPQYILTLCASGDELQRSRPRILEGRGAGAAAPCLYLALNSSFSEEGLYLALNSSSSEYGRTKNGSRSLHHGSCPLPPSA
jgi:hypothetical protein